MMDPKRNLTVVIPTFRRVDLLNKLILDLPNQSRMPDRVVVVDGDPDGNDVRHMLKSHSYPFEIVYIPSNHANAPYQRYLGAAAAGDPDWIIFIDDDIRIPQMDVIERVTQPFSWSEEHVVGVSPQIVFPARRTKANNYWEIVLQTIIKPFGRYPSGGITPTGSRISPPNCCGDYVNVNWLHGGMMAFQYGVLSDLIFIPDAFAMSHVGCGIGVDDTFLSRRVGANGRLLLALCAKVEHPDADQSRAYPAQVRKRGLAVAYSRRFLNDHYRYPESPSFGDRLYLLKTYLGNFLLNWLQAVVSFKREKFEYAVGYTLGIGKGIFIQPTAKRLTRRIDWQAEALSALSSAEVISSRESSLA